MRRNCMTPILNLLYTPFMALEILGAEYMFAHGQKKKDYFCVRFLGSSLVCIIATIWIEIIYTLVMEKMFLYTAVTDFTDSLFKVVYYLLIFLMTVVCIGLSYEMKAGMVLLCCAGGYVTQHMANNITSLLLQIPHLTDIKNMFWKQYFFQLIVYIVVYGFVYLVFVRR